MTPLDSQTVHSDFPQDLTTMNSCLYERGCSLLIREMLLAEGATDCIWEQTSQMLDVNPPSIQASSAAPHEPASSLQARPRPCVLGH